MKKATLDQWKVLYEATEKFVKNKPWEQFEDLEIFALKLPNRKEKFYCSIMGYHKTCLGLAVYKGSKGLDAIVGIANQLSLTTQEYLSFDAGWMAVYLDSEEQLSDYQMEILKQANRSCSHAEVYMVMQPHCFPNDPNEEEVILLKEVITALNEAIEYYYSLKINFDFDNNVFVYDSAKKKHRKQKLELSLSHYPMIVLNQEFLDDLEDLQRNSDTWGMDLVYLDEAFEEGEDTILRCKGFFVENQTQGVLIEGMPLKPDEEIDTVIDVILELFEENGIPERMVVRNPHMMSILMATCKELQIQLTVEDNLEMIDEVLEMLKSNESSILN